MIHQKTSILKNVLNNKGSSMSDQWPQWETVKSPKSCTFSPLQFQLLPHCLILAPDSYVKKDECCISPHPTFSIKQKSFNTSVAWTENLGFFEYLIYNHRGRHIVIYNMLACYPLFCIPMTYHISMLRYTMYKQYDLMELYFIGDIFIPKVCLGRSFSKLLTTLQNADNM